MAKQNCGVYAKAMPYSAYNGTNAVLLNYQRSDHRRKIANQRAILSSVIKEAAT